MRRLVIALVALVAVLAVLFVRRDTAPPAVPRPGPGAPPAPAPADDAQLAPPPGTTPGAEGSARESVEPAGDGPWLVLEIDPAIQPVSTPIAALVDVDGRPVLDVPATAPMSLAGLSTGRYALVPRAPGWRIEPQEIRIGRETSAHAALFVPGNLYAGHVVDRASQEAVTRASVTAAYQESGNAGVMVVDLDRIPSDGTFRLGGVPTSHGRVRFTFEAEGYVPGSTPWLDAGPGAIHGDLVVELVPDDQPLAVLAVRVIDAGEVRAPVSASITAHRLEGFRITGLFGAGRDLQPLVDGMPEREMPGPLVTARAEAGTAELSLRAPGRYQLVVASDAHAPYLSESFDVLPAERVEREVVLREGARLAGRVVVEEGDPSIDEPRSVHVNGPRSMALVLDATNSFAADGLPDGDYLARVLAADGGVVQTEPFAVREAADVTLVVRCGTAREGATVEGELVVPAEAVDFVFQIGVTAGPTLSDTASVTAPDERGRFAVHGLPAGEVFVAAIGKPRGQEHDAAPARRVVTWITVASDGTRPVDARLDASTTRVDVRLAADHLPPEVGELECFLTLAEGDPRGRELLPQATRMFLAPGREYALLGLPSGDYLLEGPGVRDAPFTATGATAVTVHPD